MFPPHSVKLVFQFLPCPFQGVSVLVLESPFYGSRRPEGQKGSKLRVVSDLLTLGWATIFESICLLHMMNRREGYPRMCEQDGGWRGRGWAPGPLPARGGSYPWMCSLVIGIPSLTPL